MIYHEQFIASIHAKTKIRVTFFDKKEEEIAIRLCAPMDYGATRRKNAKDLRPRYWFWDFESQSERGNHPLGLMSDEIHTLEFLIDPFEPTFVDWNTNWWIKRNWGRFS